MVQECNMNAVNLADAEARLTAVARPRKRIDAALLQSLTATMPPQAQGAAEVVRSMRDGGRYWCFMH
jgi:hypothetical protein